MPYVGNTSQTIFSADDVTVTDDLTVTDDASVGGNLTVTGTTQSAHVGIDVAPHADYGLTISNADDKHIRFVNGSEFGFIQLSDAGDLKVWAHGSDNIIFLNGDGSGTERVRIDSSGLLGIGTNNPSAFHSSGSHLVISAAGNAGLTIDATSSTSSSINFADGSDGSESYRGYFSYNHAQDRMNMGAAATDVLRLQNDGNVDLVNGNLLVASGHGISFAATSDASGMTSELLDDYEEGTWTPTFKSESDNNLTVGYNGTYTKAVYTKIGNRVFCQCQIDVDSLSGEDSDNLVIAGLPYAAGNYVNIGNGGGSFVYNVNWDNTPDTVIVLNQDTTARIMKSNATVNSPTSDLTASTYSTSVFSYQI